jgi:hypothetical protein
LRAGAKREPAAEVPSVLGEGSRRFEAERE